MAIIGICLAAYLVPLLFLKISVIGYWWFSLTEKGKTYGWLEFYDELYKKNPWYTGINGWESEKLHPFLITSWEVCWIPFVNIIFTGMWAFVIVFWGLVAICLNLFHWFCEFYHRHENTIYTAHFCWWKPFSRFAWKVTYPLRIVVAGICDGILWCWDKYRGIRITR